MLFPQAGKSKSRRRDKGAAEQIAATADGGDPLNTTPVGPEIGENAGETFVVQTNLVDAETRLGDDPLNRDLEPHDEEVVESSNAGHHSAPTGGAREEQARRRRRRAAEPSMKDVLTALNSMATQMTALTQAFTPLVNSSVGQSTRIPTAIPLVGAERVREAAEVVELDPEPVLAVKKVDYLSVLQHITRMGTKHFQGSTDPIEADEWRSRLIRNFKSSRCPDDYKKDIAVHFLEGDAHNWWMAVDKRTAGTIERIEDFEYEFNKKYFPAEAWDRLEAKFLYLTQGRRTVREYEEEFNRLRRYVGKELEDETVQVRRFFRGLRVELRTHCSVLTFRTVSELVEKVALLETTLAEESRVKSHAHQASGSKSNDRKRKREQDDEGGKSSGFRSKCAQCGRRHEGECWKAMGACTRCGSKDHSIQSCPKMDHGQGKSDDGRSCFHCGKTGHYKRECPKLQGEQKKSRADADRSTHAKGQTTAPRVYELSKETGESSTFQAITGMSLRPDFILLLHCIAWNIEWVETQPE